MTGYSQIKVVSIRCDYRERRFFQLLRCIAPCVIQNFPKIDDTGNPIPSNVECENIDSITELEFISKIISDVTAENLRDGWLLFFIYNLSSTELILFFGKE